jgi:hypothetical protein
VTDSSTCIEHSACYLWAYRTVFLFFVDRGQAGSIKGIGKFFGGFSPDAKHSEVTTDNLGEATAVVLATPTAHVGQTYLISGPPITYREVGHGPGLITQSFHLVKVTGASKSSSRSESSNQLSFLVSMRSPLTYHSYCI